MKSMARVRHIAAGNQSGKTTVGAAELALLALGEHPFKKSRVPNRSIIVTAKSHKDGIEDEIIPKIQEVVGSQDIQELIKDSHGRTSGILWRGGSISFLMSAEQDDVAFESKTFDMAWIDEGVRRSIYVALRRGMMKSGGLLWITSTPITQPWMYEEIYLKAQIDASGKEYATFEGSTDENPHIPEEERERFFKSLTADEVKARRYGKFQHLAGRVFKEYLPDKHRIPGFDIPKDWPVWAAIDPHPHKPHAVVYLAVGPPNEYGIEKKYICNEIYMDVSIGELAKEVRMLNEQYNMINMLIDTSAQMDGWGKRSAREILEDFDIYTRLAQKKNLKRSGIILMNQLFKDDQLFVFDHCVRTHRELMLQMYEMNKRDPEKQAEVPMKKLDDMTDCVRYVLVERPHFDTSNHVIDYVGENHA